jgi:hypothetical protein
MNRRSFLAGLGAAFAAIAVTTRLGESRLPPVPARLDYFTDPDSWYIAVDPARPGGDETAISTFYRHATGVIELVDVKFKGVSRFSQGVVP